MEGILEDIPKLESILENNNLLFTDEETENRMATGEYRLIYRYGKDKNLIFYSPYIEMFITPVLKS